MLRNWQMFVLRLSFIPMEEEEEEKNTDPSSTASVEDAASSPEPAPSDKSSGSPPAKPAVAPAEDGGETDAKALASRAARATQYSDWSLLSRLYFVDAGGGHGTIKGTVKVRLPSNGSGDVTTTGSRASLHPESSWCCSEKDVFLISNKLTDEGAGAASTTVITLVINLNRLDGSLIGKRQDVHNVVLRCEGNGSGGTAVGKVTIIQSNGAVLKLSKPLRFVLAPYKGPRCTKCLDPVETVGYTGQCGVVEYCSRQCQDAHLPGYGPLSHIMKQYNSPKARKCPATFAGAEYQVFWRNVEGTQFKVLVDSANPLGRPYEMTLDVTKEATDGVSLSFLASSETEIADAELNALNVSVFEALFYSSMEESCLPLTAIALNHVHAFCESHSMILSLYAEHCSAYGILEFHCEGVRHLASEAEYIMLVRPFFECATVYVESALKAPLPMMYACALDVARQVLLSLYNINSAVAFPPHLSRLKETLVASQQRQTLKLLAKVFVLLAVRAPVEIGHRMLRRAEECYKDSIDEDKSRNDLVNMGKTCLQLSALYLLFQTPHEKMKAKLAKEQGLELLALAKSGKKDVPRTIGTETLAEGTA